MFREESNRNGENPQHLKFEQTLNENRGLNNFEKDEEYEDEDEGQESQDEDMQEEVPQTEYILCDFNPLDFGATEIDQDFFETLTEPAEQFGTVASLIYVNQNHYDVLMVTYDDEKSIYRYFHYPVPGDGNCLFHALKVIALLDDAKLRSRLGMAARQLVLDRFDLEKICLPQQLQWVDALAQTPVRP